MERGLTKEEVQNEIQEYKKFAFNKNLFQVAIGFILATAFQKTVTAVSDYLIMPITNYLIGRTNGNWREWIIHPVPGMNIEIGHLVGALFDFLILTIVLYFFYAKFVKKLWPEIEINTSTKGN